MLIPAGAEFAVVAPVIAHARRVTAQLSAVVGFGVTTDAVQTPAPTFCAMLPGQVMVGRILSVTVTVKLHVALFPVASLTVYVTVVTPELNV